jgi:hypothetical protein
MSARKTATAEGHGDRTIRPIPLEDRSSQWVWSLRTLASHDATQALKRYGEQDWNSHREVAIAAGSASEYLYTAVIIAVDPVLLANPSHPPSVLTLSRYNRALTIDHAALRTIPMTRKIELIRQMFPDVEGKEAMKLAAWRNAALHAGHVDRDDDPSEPLQWLIAVVDALEPLIENPRGTGFWPDQYEGTIQNLRNDAATAAKRLREAKLEAARDAFRVRARGIDKVGLPAFVAALELAGRSRRPEMADERTCPACGHHGWVSLQRAITFPTVQGGDVGDPTFIGVPVYFDCGVCGLELDVDELLEFEDLKTVVTLPEHPDWSVSALDDYPGWDNYLDQDSDM